MTSINSALKYETFISNITPKISEAFTNKSAIITGLYFKGFSILALFEKMKVKWIELSMSEDQIASDLVTLLSLYHVRGPNIKSLSSKKY